MQNHKWKTKWVTFGLAVVALASSLAPSKAQAQEIVLAGSLAPSQENFAWITNTNGVTWKQGINLFGHLYLPISEEQKIAEVVVPDDVFITFIYAHGFVNLTNIVLLPALPIKSRPSEPLIISAGESGLRNITCRKTIKDRIVLLGDASFHEGEWAILQRPVQWTELPNIEIRTHSTDNGPELEIVWREGTLQITDAVNGKWKDYSGDSPLRVPLAIAKPQQFFRIRRSR